MSVSHAGRRGAAAAAVLVASCLVAAAGCGDAGSAAPKVVSPAPLVVARGDGYTPLEDMQSVYRRLESTRKRLLVEPADAGHGWNVLTDPRGRWTPLARQILAFVRSVGSS